MNDQNQPLHEDHSAHYSAHYSDDAFWDKVKRFAKKAGYKVLQPALAMYYALQDSDTPTWAKVIIIAALGYFISPIDAIPDVLPVVGFTDDLAVLVAAMSAIALHIKDEHLKLAAETLRRWFS